MIFPPRGSRGIRSKFFSLRPRTAYVTLNKLAEPFRQDDPRRCFSFASNIHFLLLPCISLPGRPGVFAFISQPLTFPLPRTEAQPTRTRGKMNVATFALGGFEGVCCQKRSGFVTRIVTPILVLKSFPGNVLFIGGGNYRRVIAPRETNKRLADERAVNSNLCETSSNVLSSSFFFFFIFLK